MRRSSATLHTLAQMRRLVVEQERQSLESNLEAVLAAETRECGAVAALGRERLLASGPDAEGSAVEAFTVWLPIGMAGLEMARAERDRTRTDYVQALARLNLARIAEEAVRRRLAELAAAERVAALKREQAGLDEIARTHAASKA